MKREFAEFVYNGVARVAAALIAHNNIVIFGEHVNHSALSFVAPVDTYNSTVRH